MVVTPENKVEPRPVKTGSAVGSKWIITDGLKAGDRVIVEGLQKVRPGMVVTVVPFKPVEPSPSRSQATLPQG